MKKFKKLLSLFISTIMIFGVLPSTVFADDPWKDPEFVSKGDKTFTFEKVSQGDGIVKIEDYEEYVALSNTFALSYANIAKTFIEDGTLALDAPWAIPDSLLRPILAAGDGTSLARVTLNGDVVEFLKSEDNDFLPLPIVSAVFEENDDGSLSVAIPNIDIIGFGNNKKQDEQTPYAEMIRTPLASNNFTLKTGSIVDYLGFRYIADEEVQPGLFLNVGGEEMFFPVPLQLWADDNDAIGYCPYYSSVEFIVGDMEEDIEINLAENENEEVAIYGEDALRATIFALVTALSTEYDGFPKDDDGHYIFEPAQGLIKNKFFKVEVNSEEKTIKLYLNLDMDEENKYDVYADLTDTVTTIETFMNTGGSYFELYSNLKLKFSKTEECSVDSDSVTINFPERDEINIDFINEGLDKIAELVEEDDYAPLIIEGVKAALNYEFGDVDEVPPVEVDSVRGIFESLTFNSVKFKFMLEQYTVTASDNVLISSDSGENVESGSVIEPRTSLTFSIKGGLKSGQKVSWSVEPAELAPTNGAKEFTIDMPEANVIVKATVTGGGGGGGSSLSYAITAQKSENGTVELSKTRAAKGTKVTVTPQPDAGYETDKITVTDKDGKEVPVTKNSDGTYSFTMPSGQVTVASAFKKADGTAEPENPVEEAPLLVVTINSMTYRLNGKTMTMDSAPFIDGNNRTMLPVRVIANALGITNDNIKWDSATKTASFTRADGKVVSCTVNSNVIKVGDENVTIDTVPVIRNGRIYLPMRALFNAFDVPDENILWDAAARTVTVTEKD